MTQKNINFCPSVYCQSTCGTLLVVGNTPQYGACSGEYIDRKTMSIIAAPSEDRDCSVWDYGARTDTVGRFTSIGNSQVYNGGWEKVIELNIHKGWYLSAPSGPFSGQVTLYEGGSFYGFYTDGNSGGVTASISPDGKTLTWSGPFTGHAFTNEYPSTKLIIRLDDDFSSSSVSSTSNSTPSSQSLSSQSESSLSSQSLSSISSTSSSTFSSKSSSSESSSSVSSSQTLSTMSSNYDYNCPTLLIESDCGQITLGPSFNPIYTSPLYADIKTMSEVSSPSEIRDCSVWNIGFEGRGDALYTSVGNITQNTFELCVDTARAGPHGPFHGELTIYGGILTGYFFGRNMGNVVVSISEDWRTLVWDWPLDVPLDEPVTDIFITWTQLELSSESSISSSLTSLSTLSSSTQSSSSNSSSSQSSSSITSSSLSSSSSSVIDKFLHSYNKNLTYISDCIDNDSITSPLVGKSAGVGLIGQFDIEENSPTYTDPNFIHAQLGGLTKTISNKALVYCPKASNLFSMKDGMVSLYLSLPHTIANGIYEPVLGKTDYYLKDFVIFSVNIGDYYITVPGIYAAFTPQGIELTYWSSENKCTILDSTSNIAANQDFVITFAWGSKDLFGLPDTRLSISIDNEPTATCFVRTSNDSLDNLYIVDNEEKHAPMFIYGTKDYISTECTVRRIEISSTAFPDQGSTSSVTDQSFSYSSHSYDRMAAHATLPFNVEFIEGTVTKIADPKFYMVLKTKANLSALSQTAVDKTKEDFGCKNEKNIAAEFMGPIEGATLNNV